LLKERLAPCPLQGDTEHRQGSGLGRSSLYRALSPGGNPEFRDRRQRLNALWTRPFRRARARQQAPGDSPTPHSRAAIIKSAYNRPCSSTRPSKAAPRESIAAASAVFGGGVAAPRHHSASRFAATISRPLPVSSSMWSALEVKLPTPAWRSGPRCEDRRSRSPASLAADHVPAFPPSLVFEPRS